MRATRLWMSLALAGALTACYHQTVQTGLAPGPTVIDMPWVPTWIFGIIPAEEIDSRNQCPSNVAMVETERSFLNGLVGVVTFGIFTPVHVRITCAGGSASLPASSRHFVVPSDATAEQRHEVLRAAIRASLAQQQAVVLRF